MSKAFTKEQDDRDLDDDDGEERAPSLPPGAKNYITPGGAKKMQDELYDLRFKQRPQVTQTVAWAAGNGDRSENGDYLYGKKKLREMDRRIRFLSKRLDLVEVVDPIQVACDQVRFGATVTIRDEDDVEKTYVIVGADEIDLKRGRISWISPLATALLKARVGDVVTFRAPGGVKEIEIISLEYREIEP